MKKIINYSPTVYVFALYITAALLLLVSCKEKTGTPTLSPSETSGGTSLYADTATSSVKVFDQNGKVCIQQSNTYYEVINAYDGKEKIPLLLKIKKTELCFADSINKEKVYEIAAQTVLDKKTISWQTQFVATQVEFKDNTILATKEGGDGEEDFIKRFSLLTGKEIFSCSYGDLRVAIPNVREKRFIGFTSLKATTNPLAELKEENLLGVISYAAENTIHRIFLKLKRSKVNTKIPTSTPDMVLVPLNGNTTAIEDGKTIVMMRLDEHYSPADISDFCMKLTIYYGDDNEATDITIPVKHDKFEVSAAKFDHELFEIIQH